jgi:hypothetical protein
MDTVKKNAEPKNKDPAAIAALFCIEMSQVIINRNQNECRTCK